LFRYVSFFYFYKKKKQKKEIKKANLLLSAFKAALEVG